MSPQRLSLSVTTDQARTGFGRVWPFLGPGMLVSVGYMDPGNWATDLEGGARFGYQLLWVLAVSNLVALLLQTLAVRLGLVSGLDLAQACREMYRRPAAYMLWFFCEIAIIACDLAEVIGSAVALNLLFGIPMIWGAIITVVDVLMILMLQRFGARKLEAVALVMVLTVAACFAFELYLVHPDWREAARGLRPQIDRSSLYIAIGILGATVMPHNLYLHSALVKTRVVAPQAQAQARALRFNFIDTLLSLNFAFLINAAILIVSAAVFFRAAVPVDDLRDAHRLLAPLLGASIASALFAVALLCAGQAATVTGTLAGQIVMEGFLKLRLSPMVRRLLTRLLAVVPAIAVLELAGEKSALNLLVITQVVLSLQLPFAIVPLIRFTSSRHVMQQWASGVTVRWLGWMIVASITAANVWLVINTVAAIQSHWMVLCVFVYAAALGYVAFARLRPAPYSSHDRGFAVRPALTAV
jgi:manganese transport protein